MPGGPGPLTSSSLASLARAGGSRVSGLTAALAASDSTHNTPPRGPELSLPSAI